jgi:glycosyltransferase involved in cell wall biosynthesis
LTPFSVIIPVYNEESIILANTESLMGYLQQRHAAFEVIIGSNGSTDKTVVLGTALADRFAEVGFFHLPERGVGHAFKQGVRKAGSGLFIFCARHLLGLSFEDYSIAAKAYQRSLLLDHLDQIDHGTSYVIDIICLVHRNGGRIIEIPVMCEDYRPSKFNILHEGFYRFWNLFKLWRRTQSDKVH